MPNKGDIAISIESTIYFPKGKKFLVLNSKNSTIGDGQFVQIEINTNGLKIGWFYHTYFKFYNRVDKLKRILRNI
jgi:hypothetical protein